MTKSSPESFSPSFWEKLLVSPLPLIGKWGQRIALSRLIHDTLRDDSRAIHALVGGLSSQKTGEFHTEIAGFLSGSLPTSSQDRLWEEWVALRLLVVEEILLKKKKQASSHSPAWAISSAKLERIDSLQSVQPERLADLLHLRTDPDPVVTASANVALKNLTRQESRNELYRLWSFTRSEDIWDLARTAGYVPQEPVEVRVLYMLKVPEAKNFASSTPEMVSCMIDALQDRDPAIASQARRCLPLVQSETGINALCHHWQQNRTPVLVQIISEGRMIATRPIELRLMTALINRRSDITRQSAAEAIPHLLDLTNDIDPELAQSAREALLSLEEPSAQAALCMIAVNQNHEQAFGLAIKAGYRPSKPEQLALFLFMAGLWGDYDNLDFDNRLMQAAYDTAPPALRQRIASQVQRTGKSAYLTILAGFDFRSNTSQLSAGENRVLVELLVENREWSRLWSLVHLVPLPWSIHILQSFTTESWHPENPAENEEYFRLTDLARGLPQPDRLIWENSLPPAVPAARVRVSGRVNDVCFAPHEPIIAIGASNRKLAIWDYQKAEIKRIRQGFSHSIARVAFVGSEFLVCGVRSNVDSACWIYGWHNDDAFVLPGHQGATTALLPVGDADLVSAGRDGMVIHWSLARKAEITRQAIPDWPRTAILASDQKKIVLLHKSLSILRFPDLAYCDPQTVRTAAYTGTRQSMAKCGGFVPGTDEFLIGQLNGQVVRYFTKPQNRGFTREVVLKNKSSVVDLEFIPSQPVLLTATRNGTIEFRHWPDFTRIGLVSTESGRLTSLHISPDGSFMATGTDDSSMQFWDLRVRDLPALIDRPLSSALPAHLAAVTGLLHNPEVQLEPRLRQTLELTEALLQRRFRYDIQLEELCQIQPGEFDIILE